MIPVWMFYAINAAATIMCAGSLAIHLAYGDVLWSILFFVLGVATTADTIKTHRRIKKALKP